METLLLDRFPKPHREFLERALPLLSREPWLVGIAATGSFITNTMDAFSDLDLVLAVETEQHAAVMEDRRALAESLSPLLSVFTGEHVGQPRLLLCLYGPPLLHVDMIFDTLPDAAKRGADLAVLWERDGRLSALLERGAAAMSPPNFQWTEDRFWVWVHKAAGKIGRGELFEAIEYLAFLRSRALGPLALYMAGQPPLGVRRIESVAPALAEDLKNTLAHHDARACLAALRACVEQYRVLRARVGVKWEYHHAAESAVTEYLAGIERALIQL